VLSFVCLLNDVDEFDGSGVDKITLLGCDEVTRISLFIKKFILVGLTQSKVKEVK
jgi:hypothetical protein